MMGRKFTPEHLASMSRAQKGRKHTAEHIAAVVAGKAAARAKREAA